jgi:hypothetical protein
MDEDDIGRVFLVYSGEFSIDLLSIIPAIACVTKADPIFDRIFRSDEFYIIACAYQFRVKGMTLDFEFSTPFGNGIS